MPITNTIPVFMPSKYVLGANMELSATQAIDAEEVISRSKVLLCQLETDEEGNIGKLLPQDLTPTARQTCKWAWKNEASYHIFTNEYFIVIKKQQITL